mmetsp:Transcript_2132/g.6451  ORF Transcript_2132/g.6451 Transcript_2132/m.6451 type:complete len:308 (-) Transcript_2132:302-1225(-)
MPFAAADPSSGAMQAARRQSPPKSTVSATRATLYATKSNALTNADFWLRKSPVRVMSPGLSETAVVASVAAARRRAASSTNNTLQSLESLYALSPSKEPPSAISNSGPPLSPLRSPRVAGGPTLPPGVAGSCTCDAVTTSRRWGGFSLLLGTQPRSSGIRRLANRKCARWLTPTASSKPSLVRTGLLASVEGATPALRASTCRGPAPLLPRCGPSSCHAAANLRTLARLARSQAKGTARPTPEPGMKASASSVISRQMRSACSIVRQGTLTTCPRFTILTAASRPMPLLAPVTMTFSGFSGAATALR